MTFYPDTNPAIHQTLLRYSFSLCLDEKVVNNLSFDTILDVNQSLIIPASIDPVILPPLSGKASSYDSKLRSAAQNYKRCLWEIAFYGYRLRAGNWYGELGFKNEEGYRESLDIPRSTYYKFVRLGEALQDLTIEEMQELSVGNAELLLQVDEKLMGSFPWVQEARTLSPGEFAEKITERNREIGSDKEPSQYYRLKVPFTAKAAIERTVSEFQAKHSLASPMQALEFIMADQIDRPNMLAICQGASLTIKNALVSLREIPDIEDVVNTLEGVASALDEVAVYAVQQHRSGQ